MARLCVDQDLCQGHGLCYGGWPELFGAHEDGIAYELAEELTAEQYDEAVEAVESCPEQAITVVED